MKSRKIIENSIKWQKIDVNFALEMKERGGGEERRGIANNEQSKNSRENRLLY